MQLPLKVNKEYFLTSSMASNVLKTKVSTVFMAYLCMASNTMDKEIIKVMTTKFSKMFVISMLKKHRKSSRTPCTSYGLFE